MKVKIVLASPARSVKTYLSNQANQGDKPMTDKSYTIAMIGDMLAATFVDGDDDMFQERLSDTLDQIDPGREEIHDIWLCSGLTLFETVEDAEKAGAEIIYSGVDCGWLQDEDDQAIYMAAARLPS